MPAGHPDGGRWTDAGGAILLAAAFSDEQLDMRVEDFVSAYCLGSINRELPGQFLGMTIAEVLAIARLGDAAARKCIKLIGSGDYRK